MSNRTKRSIIWKQNKTEFQELVKRCSTLADILRTFNLHVGAGNYKTLRRRIEQENINIAHIPTGINSNKNRKPFGIDKITIPLEKILVENSTYNTGKNIKRRLFKAGLLHNKCYECGQLPFWNNKPLVLQLDHINGVNTDNRIENLQILCGHCHSQTKTFSGRNIKWGSA